jgi:hypothetical protein
MIFRIMSCTYTNSVDILPESMKIHNCLFAGIIGAGALLAQQPNATTPTTAAPAAVVTLPRRLVSPENLYYHIITVVPFTGKGIL